MNRLLAVAARELRERWLLLPASLVFGFNPLVLPAFGVDRQALPLVGIVTAVGMSAAAAVVMGSTMLARDAANGRLGFLFSRPVSWFAIWGGKWLAALVLVVGTGLLAAIPWMAAFPIESLGGHHGDSWLGALARESEWRFALAALLLAVAITNFAATAFRSRSPWLVLDMVLAAAVLWIARQYVAPLWRYGVVGKDDWSLQLALAPVAVGLFAGSAAQVAIGRSDVRRAHRALSIVFWSVVGTALAGGAGYWQWVLSATPADVSVHALARDPAGRWAYVEGGSPRGGWYPYGFLIDTASGRWAPRPQPDTWERGIPLGARFSSDGRFFTMLTSDGRGAAVVRFDLAANPPQGVRATLESSPPPDWSTSFALSASADSAFVVHESGASIFALPSGRRVATTTIGPGWRPVATRYLEGGGARAWLVPWNARTHTPAQRAELRVVDLSADGRARTGVFPLRHELEAPAVWRAVRPDADGRRIITFDAGAQLRDGSTGAWLATLSESIGSGTARFLADGRVVVAEADGSRAAAGRPATTLRVFDNDGKPVGAVPLDLGWPLLGMGPEVAPGRIVVSALGPQFVEQDTVLVDVAAGRVVERMAGLGAVAGFWFGPAAHSDAEGASSVQFLRDKEGRVVRLDFASGARTAVGGRGAVRGERLRVEW